MEYVCTVSPTTTRWVNKQTTTVNTMIRFDISYIATLPGILKAAQMIFNFIGFMLVVQTEYGSNNTTKPFNVFALIGFTISGILLSFHLFHVIEKFQQIPWIEIEFVYCSTMTGGIGIAAAFMAQLGVYSNNLAAAAFFGFCAMIAYATDAWLRYLAYKRGGIDQDDYQRNKNFPSTTSNV